MQFYLELNQTLSYLGELNGFCVVQSVLTDGLNMLVLKV